MWQTRSAEPHRRAIWRLVAILASGSAVVFGQSLAVAASGDGNPLPLAVLDLELAGDTGGPQMAAEHQTRLAMESERLRQELARSGMFQVVDTAAAKPLIDRLRSEHAFLHDCNGCDLEVGHLLHAEATMVPWVDRVSGLILSLTYEIHDVASGQILARKSFDFRGDNDAAWNHAIKFMVNDLKENPPSRSPPSSPEPQ